MSKKEMIKWILGYMDGKNILLFIHLLMNPLQYLAKTFGAAMGFERVLESLIKLNFPMFLQGLAIYILGIIIAAVSNAVDTVLCEKLECEIRNEMKQDILAVHLQARSMGKERRHSGEILELCGVDTETAASLCGTILGSMITPLVVSSVCITALAIRSRMIAAIIGFSMICVFCMNYYFLPKYRLISHEVRKKTETMTSCFEDGLAGAAVLRIFRYQKEYLNKMLKNAEMLFQSEMKEVHTHFMHGLIVNLLGFSSMTVPFVAGAFLVMDGSMQVEGLMYVTQLSGNLLWLMDCLVNALMNLEKTMVSSQRIRDFLAEPLEEEKQIELFRQQEAVIEFKDICVNYGELSVLKHISFTIPKGSKVAFVGESGSGKTTLLKVIEGFVPYTGKVFFLGELVSYDNIRFMRRKINYVSQNMGLLNDTIYENISIGDKNAGNKAVKCAAKEARVDEFAETLERGMETPIGELGGKLSGGQRQRIALARGFLKNAPLILLDEVTSALDADNEKKIMDEIKNNSNFPH